MLNNSEKRYIPGTNPKWNRELPDGYDNSLVDKYGKPYDDGYNFDERSDDETTYDNLKEEVKFDPEAAQAAKEAADQEQSE